MIIYRAEPASMMLMRPLDDFTLLYHRRSGVTHMLAEPMPVLIDLLQTPQTITDLVTRLQRDYDLEGDDSEESVADMVAARLDELVALGLVSTFAGQPDAA